MALLAMYDVRGIQNYIFKTNKIKDIIGASNLVENIILEGLNAIIKNDKDLSKTACLTDWENDDSEAFLSDESIQMQVLFIGGGNAYVLYRNKDICTKLNRGLSKYILEHTYSLNLAVAVIDKTDNYNDDYKKINEKMLDIKSKMPQTKPMGAFPFMAIDHSTGYPLSSEFNYDKEKEYVSTETKLKRDSAIAIIKKEKGIKEDEEANKILDNMITKKGENSFLAVVHIDGNSMGNRIKEIMKDKKTYSDAIETMRKISKTLKNTFNECYNTMSKEIDYTKHRKIIVAGDDVTFICNAQYAITAVKDFLNLVAQKDMYLDEALSKDKNRKNYAMSACAGIAFFKSHFPFSVAYEVAEACCANAKQKAKLAENRDGGKVDGMIGCYLDYQVCTHIKATDLQGYRVRNYTMTDGTSMIYRPYYVSSACYDDVFDINTRNKDWDIETILQENLKVFSNKEESRNKYKKLRNAFSFGMEKVCEEIVFLESRKTKLPETTEISWYDALEIVDIISGEAKDETKSNVIK